MRTTAWLLSIVIGSGCTHQHLVRRSAPLPETYNDHRRGAVEGATAGLLIGGLGGMLGGLATGGDPPCQGDDTFGYCERGRTSAGQYAFGFGLILGALGAATGAFVGAAHGSADVYQYVPEERVRITPTVAGGQVGASAAWGF